MTYYKNYHLLWQTTRPRHLYTGVPFLLEHDLLLIGKCGFSASHNPTPNGANLTGNIGCKKKIFECR
jgi:hypothetical protein